MLEDGIPVLRAGGWSMAVLWVPPACERARAVSAQASGEQRANASRGRPEPGHEGNYYGVFSPKGIWVSSWRWWEPNSGLIKEFFSRRVAQWEFWFRKTAPAGVGRMEGRSGQEPRARVWEAITITERWWDLNPGSPGLVGGGEMEVGTGVICKAWATGLITTDNSRFLEKPFRNSAVYHWKKNQYINKPQIKIFKYLILNQKFKKTGLGGKHRYPTLKTSQAAGKTGWKCFLFHFSCAASNCVTWTLLMTDTWCTLYNLMADNWYTLYNLI